MIRRQRVSDWRGLRVAAILSGVIAALYFARELFIPLAFAVTLALLLSPAVSWLQKLRIGRVTAVMSVMLLAIGIAACTSYVIFNQLVHVVNELPAYRETIHKKLRTFSAPDAGGLGRVAQSVKELQKELATAPDAPTPQAAQVRDERARTAAIPVPVQMVEAPLNPLVYIRDLTRPFLSPLAMLGIVLVFTVFLLVEEADLRSRLFRLAGLSQLNAMTLALDDAARRVSRYLMLQFLVNAGFGVLCAVGLYFIGLPYAALWGAVAALLRIIPYVGSVAAGLLPLMLSLAVFDGWVPPLLVFGMFTLLELATGNFLEPWLYGAHTGISALALLVTTVFWATLWGPAGLILSTPLTVCVVVLGRHVSHLAFLHTLLGDQPAMAPEAQVYQRLLAMDEQEARAVVEEYCSQASLLQLYDAVMLPVLTMVEQDRHKGALEPEREEFLFLCVREMLAEFAEKAQTGHDEEQSGALPVPAVAGRILCFAAHDEADEIAATMLTQLLEQADCAAISFPVGSSPRNVLGVVEPTAADVFCISAVPPFAFSNARTLSLQLRGQFPKTKILVGIWGFGGDRDRALQRLQSSFPDKLATSFAEALEYLGVATPAADVKVVG